MCWGHANLRSPKPNIKITKVGLRYCFIIIIIIYLFILYSVQTKLPFKTETVAKIKVKQKNSKILHKNFKLNISN